MLNISLRPYGNRALNDTEDVAIGVQIVTIYIGLFFISRVESKDDPGYDPNTDFYMSDTMAFSFSFAIVAFNMFFVITWVMKFIATMKGVIKQNGPQIYTCLFLCCRKDKLPKEDIKIARTQKREMIIEKIEEIQFFIKKMEQIYTKEIYYEGHEKFIDLLYYIEKEKKDIDLTVKRHNLYIQGTIARERKYDKERLKQVAKNPTLSIDYEQGGLNLKMQVIKYFHEKRKGKDERKLVPVKEPELGRPS